MTDIIKPIVSRIAPFDASKGTRIYYIYTGSRQTVANNILIKDKETGLGVYSFDYTALEKVHDLPPDVILNGKQYLASVRVKFIDETYSSFSDEVLFTTVKTPILDIENIDGLGYVYNSDVTFIAKYTQEYDEPVKTYRFSLYNEYEGLIQNYPLRTPTDNIFLTETIRGLEKSKGYFVECVIETESGFSWSHRERFVAIYIVPSINGVVQTNVNSDEGFVKITAGLKQLLGTQVRATDPNDTYISDNYEYEDKDWVVIPSDNPLIFRGLNMNRVSDFVMKIWCKDVPINSMFLEISPKDDTGVPIQFWRYEDRIVAVKKHAGVASRYCSNIIPIPLNTEFMIYAKVIEHRVDLILKTL